MAVKIGGITHLGIDAEEYRADYVDFYEEIKKAIHNNQINEYFANFGFKPRYLDIVDICLLFPDGELVVQQIYNHIIANISGYKAGDLIESLAKYESFIPLLERDFAILYRKVTDIIENVSVIQLSRSFMYDFALKAAELPHGEALLLPRMNDILKQIYVGLSDDLISKADFLDIIMPKLDFPRKIHQTIPAIITSKRSEYLKLLLNQLMQNQGVLDFNAIGEESQSNIVFRVGQKVLKVGWQRFNPDMPSHFRILEPETFEIIYDEDGKPLLYLEIFEFVRYQQIYKEDVRDFYVDLDAAGLLHTDNKGDNFENFGILENPEPVIKKYTVSDSFRKRPVVLIDRDCVWHKSDERIKYFER